MLKGVEDYGNLGMTLEEGVKKKVEVLVEEVGLGRRWLMSMSWKPFET